MRCLLLFCECDRKCDDSIVIVLIVNGDLGVRVVFGFPSCAQKRSVLIPADGDVNQHVQYNGGIATPQNLLNNYHEIHYSSIDKDLLVLWVISRSAGNQLQM